MIHTVSKVGCYHGIYHVFCLFVVFAGAFSNINFDKDVSLVRHFWLVFQSRFLIQKKVLFCVPRCCHKMALNTPLDQHKGFSATII